MTTPPSASQKYFDLAMCATYGDSTLEIGSIVFLDVENAVRFISTGRQYAMDGSSAWEDCFMGVISSYQHRFATLTLHITSRGA